MNFGLKILIPIALFIVPWLNVNTPMHNSDVLSPPIPVPHVPPLSSIPDVLNSHLLKHYCCFRLHAPGPVIPCIMASFRLHSHPPALLNSGLILAHSSFSSKRTLLDVIIGEDEGFLQEI